MSDSAGTPVVDVPTAATLGWQMTQLFHEPVHSGVIEAPPLDKRLPALSAFAPASRASLLGDQIAALADKLLSPSATSPVGNAVNVMTSALATSDRTEAGVHQAVFDLHCKLLESLTVADYRLGKAYGLGRALAETALVPTLGAPSTARAGFTEMFDEDRLITIHNWLVDLKSLLPAHTAYALSQNLDDWKAWTQSAKPADSWVAARPVLRTQGRMWRALITGEKSSVDILKLSDYAESARQVVSRACARPLGTGTGGYLRFSSRPG